VPHQPDGMGHGHEHIHERKQSQKREDGKPVEMAQRKPSRKESASSPPIEPSASSSLSAEELKPKYVFSSEEQDHLENYFGSLS
jgi:hypothetical protein